MHPAPTTIDADALSHAIGWTDATVNPGIYGCAIISPACTNCYAMSQAERLVRFANGRGEASPYEGTTTDGRWNGTVRVDYARPAIVFGGLPGPRSRKIRRVFVTSMADLFHVLVPFDFLDLAFAEMEARPWLAFQALTKRAERMAEYAADRRRRGLSWPANVWAGVTAETQAFFDERVYHLRRVPAAVRFVSIEPMLGPINADPVTCPDCESSEHVRWPGDEGMPAEGNPWCIECDTEAGGGFGLDACASATQRGVNWIIVGCESDGNRPGKRATDPAWVRDLVAQCDRAGVPVFVKQLVIDGALTSRPTIDGAPRLAFPTVG